MGSDCLNLRSIPTQIEFWLKKLNSSPIQVLKMIVQAHPNVRLDSVCIKSIRPSYNPISIYIFQQFIVWDSIFVVWNLNWENLNLSHIFNFYPLIFFFLSYLWSFIFNILFDGKREWKNGNFVTTIIIFLLHF